MVWLCHGHQNLQWQTLSGSTNLLCMEKNMKAFTFVGKKGLQCNFSAIGAVTRATMRHCEWWLPREQGLRPGFQDLDWQSSVSPLQLTASTKCIGPSNHRFNWCYFYWIKQRCYFGNHLLVSGKELETMILSQNASNRKYWNKCKKKMWPREMAHLVDGLPCKHEGEGSNPQPSHVKARLNSTCL